MPGCYAYRKVDQLLDNDAIGARIRAPCKTAFDWQGEALELKGMAVKKRRVAIHASIVAVGRVQKQRACQGALKGFMDFEIKVGLLCSMLQL